MGLTRKNERNTPNDNNNGRPKGFIFRLAVLYTEYKYSRPITVKLLREEISSVVEALDVWTEGYKGSAYEDEELIEGLHDQMSIVIDARDKLWRMIK